MPWMNAHITVTQSWQVPEGVTMLSISAQGPPGAGGHANETFGGGGGGGGGSSSVSDIPVTPGSLIGCVIGPAGKFDGTPSSFTAWFGSDLGSQVVCYGGTNGDIGIGGVGGQVSHSNVNTGNASRTNGLDGYPGTLGENDAYGGAGGGPNGATGQGVGESEDGHEGEAGYIDISYEVKIEP